MDSIHHQGDFILTQPAETLFPLFSPEGERAWIPGWDYVNLMGHTDLHEDYLFLTRASEPGQPDTIWLCKRHEPERFCVSFYKITPGHTAGRVDVRCTPLEPNRTRVTVGYHYRALSDEGRRFVDGYDARTHADTLATWQRLLNDHFATQR